MKKFDKLERTPWFSGAFKPARPGVYERRYVSGTVLFAEWTGYNWLYGHRTPRLAIRERNVSWANASWRGLAQEVKS